MKRIEELYEKDDLRNIFENLLLCLETKSLPVSSWVFNMIASTLKKYAKRQKVVKNYTDVEVEMATYIRNLFGHGIATLLQVNVAFPDRTTCMRRTKSNNKCTLKNTNRN
jgi:hypothetical protein